jgi:hypothetical protein
MLARHSDVQFVARVVFLGEIEREQPTICSDLEIRRLLLHRLEVIEAALLQLLDLQSKAATTPEGFRGCSHEGYHYHFS